jgi:hypothetical protein
MVVTGWNSPPMQDHDLAYGGARDDARHHPSPPGGQAWPLGPGPPRPSLGHFHGLVVGLDGVMPDITLAPVSQGLVPTSPQ